MMPWDGGAPPVAVLTLLLAGAGGLVSLGSPGARPPGASASEELGPHFTVTAEDAPGRCADVGTTPYCWSEDGPTRVVAPRPAGIRAAWGFRCWTAGGERRCADRAGLSSSFECRGTQCAQEHPFLPDAGEWECVDRDGGVVCRSHANAAHLEDVIHPAFHCGERRGHPGQRICVDLSPDQPPGMTGTPTCTFSNRGLPRRLCDASTSTGTTLGAPCVAGHDCPDGLACAAGRCVPPRLDPACWLDTDCPRGRRCVAGSCT